MTKGLVLAGIDLILVFRIDDAFLDVHLHGLVCEASKEGADGLKGILLLGKAVSNWWPVMARVALCIVFRVHDALFVLHPQQISAQRKTRVSRCEKTHEVRFKNDPEDTSRVSIQFGSATISTLARADTVVFVAVGSTKAVDRPINANTKSFIILVDLIVPRSVMNDVF